MVVIEIERNNETVGAMLIDEYNLKTGQLEIENTSGYITIRDIDFDDIFETNQTKIRIDIDEYLDKKENQNNIRYTV